LRISNLGISNMQFRTAFALAAMLLGIAATSSAQAVSLQFNNGRVTLNAQNAPVRTILVEWARLGGTRIVNGDRVGGAPVTLELTDVPERAALDILLRSAAGYIATARQEPGGPSSFGGVVILATTSAPQNQAPVTFGATTVQQQRPIVEDEERTGVAAAPVLPGVPTAPTVPGPSVVRIGPNALPQNNLPGGQSPFAQQQQQPESGQTPAQPGPARPSTTVQTLPGTSRPGEITPPPPAQPQPAR
jgi:hypothetical protein